jgi:hypothetical protein
MKIAWFANVVQAWKGRKCFFARNVNPKTCFIERFTSLELITQ